MKTIFKSGTYVLFFLGNFCVYAQEFELFKVQSTYYPKQSLEGSALDWEIGFWEWSGQLTIPQPLKNNKTIFLHQLSYSHLRAEIDGSFPNGLTEAAEGYHTISYGLGIVQVLNPKWQLLVNLTPTIASDLTGSLTGDDFFFLANGMAIHNKNSKLKYGFGLAYTTNFGQRLVIPMGMIKYKTPKATLDILLPNRLSVMFNTNKSFHYGLLARLDGAFFNNNSVVQIVNDEISGAGYSRLNIGPQINFRLKETIKINLEGGMAVARRLDFIDVTGGSIDTTPNNGPFIRVGLSFTPKIENGARSSKNRK